MSARRFTGHTGTPEHDTSVVLGSFASTAPARLRLTRRGRVVVGGLVAFVLIALLAFAAVLISPQAFASESASGDQQFHYVVAQPGESLWSLASELDPQADPRDLIAEIVQLNQLDSEGVEAGQAIAVPLRYSDNKNVVSADASSASVSEKAPTA